MSSGSNYWPFDSQPNLDDSYGAIILENSDGSSTYNVPYLNSDVQQGGFIEFGIEIPKGKDTELYFDWEFTGKGDGYENDAAFIGTTVKYEGNSYYEPINWEIIDFAVGFGPWVWNDNTILEYEDGIGQFDSGEELYDQPNLQNYGTSGYFEVDFGEYMYGGEEYVYSSEYSISSAKVIIGAAEISVDGWNNYSDNIFSISNIGLEVDNDDDDDDDDDDGYTLPGDDDDDDDDYTLPGDDEDNESDDGDYTLPDGDDDDTSPEIDSPYNLLEIIISLKTKNLRHTFCQPTMVLLSPK